MEEVKELMSIVTSIVGTFWVLIKGDWDANKKRTQEYYQQVLVPFVKAYKKNKKMNTIAFLEPLVRGNNDSIPRYIEYLMEKGKIEDINMVLQYDYLELYKNDENKMFVSLRMVRKIVDIFIYVLSVFFLFIAGFYIAEGGMSVFFSVLEGAPSLAGSNDIIKGGLAIIISSIAMYFLVVSAKDPYTLKKNKMERLVNKKIKTFKEKKENYFL